MSREGLQPNGLHPAEFTTREWCRHGRIRAEKRHSGRGKHCDWVIAHDEMLRYRREGLLPNRRGQGSHGIDRS